MTYYFGKKLTRKSGDKYVDAIMTLCERAMIDALEVGSQTDRYGAMTSFRTRAFHRLMQEVRDLLHDKRVMHEVEWDEEED